MDKEFNECLLSLAETNFDNGDFCKNVMDSMKSRANIRLNISSHNIAGLQLPVFSLKK
jgi:vacuolar-type H+-ATPase subunit D/Vma8